MKQLIITNLNDFDINQKDIVLLGPWCLRELKQKEKYWDEILFDPLFANAAEIDEASEYIMALSEHLIKDYSIKLNQLHKKAYSDQYWGILLMPWIIKSLEIFFTRYLYLKRYLNKEFRVSIYKDKTMPVFRNSIDLYNYLLTNNGTHFSYSLLIDYLKPINFTIHANLESMKKVENRKKHKTAHQKRIKAKHNLNLYRRAIKQNINLMISSLTGVYIDGIKGINLLDNLEIGIKSNFLKKTKMQSSPKISLKKNKQNFSGFQSKNIEFENFIYENLFKLIPTNFTDDFKGNQSKANNKIESLYRKTNTFFITGGVGGIDQQRFLLGRHKEKGGALAIAQHGGWGYGMCKSFPAMASIEYRIADYFLSWGWSSHSNYKVNVAPLPSPLLSKTVRSKNASSEIILVGSQVRLTGDRIASRIQTEQSQEYRREKINFVRSLDRENSKHLLYRPYFSEIDSFPERSLLRENFPKLKYLESNFHKKLMRAKCVIIDAPGTTIDIALSADIPTILFWNASYWTMEPYLEEICTKFMELKILHPNGRSAAKFLNSISGNITSWWQSKAVVEVKNEYKAEYALTSKDWKNKWIDFIKNKRF